MDCITALELLELDRKCSTTANHTYFLNGGQEPHRILIHTRPAADCQDRKIIAWLQRIPKKLLSFCFPTRFVVGRNICFHEDRKLSIA